MLLFLFFVGRGSVRAVVPTGYVDSAGGGYISGWAYDPDEPLKSINLHIYREESDGRKVFLGAVGTTIARADVNRSRNISGNHGFKYTIPETYLSGRQIFHVYGIDSQGGVNAELIRSPISVTNGGGTPGPTTTPIPGREKIIRVPDNINDLEIKAPIPGKNVTECGRSDGSTYGWNISQWNNEQSLCKSSVTTSTSCPGADIVKSTLTSRFCYWNSNKKVQMAVNTQQMSYEGCWVHKSEAAASNPGGYSVYLSADLKKDPEWWTSPYYSVGKLKGLRLSTNYQTNSFSYGSCPEGVSDPKVGRDPVAFAYLNIIASEVDPVVRKGLKTIFYQTVLYDNRVAWQRGERSYFNCGLESSASGSGFVVVGNPINKYGQSMGMPGGGEKNYSWDILADLKASMLKCKSDTNLDNLRISGIFMGNELYNTTVMANTFTDPKMILTLKDGVTVPVSGGDADGNGKVDLGDFVAWSKEYKGQLTTKTADFNKDGKVDLSDFVIWQKGYKGA